MSSTTLKGKRGATPPSWKNGACVALGPSAQKKIPKVSQWVYLRFFQALKIRVQSNLHALAWGRICLSLLSVAGHRWAGRAVSLLQLLMLASVSQIAVGVPLASAQTTLSRFSATVATSPIRIVRGDRDLDGDAVPDIVTAGSSQVWGLAVTAHSGATGAKLWDFTIGGVLVPIALTTGDFNGDGTNDVLFSASPWMTSNNEPAEHIFALSGKSGRELFRFTATEGESSLGSALEAIPLYGTGLHSFLVASRFKNGERAESAVTLYTFMEGAIFEDCSFNTGLTEAISQIHTIPDFDGDSMPDVVFGVPSVANGSLQRAGAMYFMSSNGCTIAQITRGPVADARLGSYFSSIGDWNADGTQDFAVGWNRVLSLHSGKDYTTVGGPIVVPSEYQPATPIVPLSDLNGDGLQDFGTVVADPAQSSSRRALLISTRTNTLIGNFSLSPFAPTANRSRLSSDIAGFLPNMTSDRNGDGIPDLSFFVRSYYDQPNDPLDQESPLADISTISGTCPREVTITFINTPHGATVEAGKRPVFAKASACGIDLPGTLRLEAAGVTYQMYDTGENGDEIKGDLVYTAQAVLPAGPHKLTISATVNNTVDLTGQRSVNVTAAPNYQVTVKDTFDWIEPVGHDKVASDTSIGTTIKLPFGFPFYGRAFSQAFLSERGILLPLFPDNTGTGTSRVELGVNKRLPTPALLDPAIAPAWGFSAFRSTTAIYSKTLGSAGNQRFVLTLEGVEFQYDSAKKSRLDYQVVFHEATGRISVHYKLIYSSELLDDKGFSVTMGMQAGPHLGVTFSHRNPVISKPLSIEYTPKSEQGDGDTNGGGGNGGNGNTGGGTNGGGGTGGNGAGGNTNGGGGQQEGEDGSNTPGDNTPPPTKDQPPTADQGQPTGPSKPTYGFSFRFSQNKSGARLVFDVSSDIQTATQSLSDCTFYLLGGEGSSASKVSYQSAGSIRSNQARRELTLGRFTQSVLTPKASRQTGQPQSVYLRARASCPASGIDLVSAPLRIKSSKQRGALATRRWLARLASQLN